MNISTHFVYSYQFLVVLFSLASVSHAFAIEQPPNIVFILGDDQAWHPVGEK